MLHNKKQNACGAQSGENPCDGCSELAAFDSQHNTQVLSPKLSQKRCSLTTKINYHHDPFILRLPFELASMVFIFCVDDAMDMSFSCLLQYPIPKQALKLPLHLGKVCRAWRAIAWATPQLWKTMTLLVHEMPEISIVGLVHQLLSRSGQQPLSITLIFLNYLQVSEHVHKSTSSLFRAIQDHSHRWRRMQLCVPQNCLYGILGGIYSLPLLENLKIHPDSESGGYTDSLDIQLVNMPLLTRVEFEDLYLQSISL
jgi:hypothetical protein